MKKLVCLLGGLLPLLSHANGLDQLKAFLETTHSARGSFYQSVASKSGRKPQQSSGSFALQRPGKFRWHYEKPYPQLLVSDGDKFWSFDPDLNQVTVRKLGKALGSSPAALLAGGDLGSTFDLKDAGQVERQHGWASGGKARIVAGVSKPGSRCGKPPAVLRGG